jgi:hypothetical protein
MPRTTIAIVVAAVIVLFGAIVSHNPQAARFVDRPPASRDRRGFLSCAGTNGRKRASLWRPFEQAHYNPEENRRITFIYYKPKNKIVKNN